MNQTEHDWIQHPIAPTKHSIGRFITPTLAQLRKNITRPTVPTIPKFIIYVRGPKNYNDTYFDTSSLQLMNYPTQRSVMFQVASNFNCQENPSHMTNFRTSDYLTHLMSDSTQGPAAAAGAGVGAIVRLMTHLSSEINLLDQTIYGSHVIGGKLHIPTQTQAREVDMDNVKIGLHMDVSANFDRSTFDRKCRYHDPGQIIDQVFTATLMYPTPDQYTLTQSLLSSCYMGTYLSAMYRRTEVLVLTLVGGGAFRNPYEMIVKAIVEAHLQLGITGQLKQVILPLYDSDHDPDLLVKMLISGGYPNHLISIIPL